MNINYDEKEKCWIASDRRVMSEIERKFEISHYVGRTRAEAEERLINAGTTQYVSRGEIKFIYY